MAREVWAKRSFSEVGVGSVQAIPAWESEPTDEGAMVRLDVAPSGDLFITLTDAEEFDGAFASVQVTPDDLKALGRSFIDLLYRDALLSTPGFWS